MPDQEKSQEQLLDELRRLREQSRWLELGVLDSAVCTLDPEGIVTSWNAGAERFHGYAEQEILGRHFSCFYPVADVGQGKPRQALGRAAEAGRFEEEGWRVRKDGSRFWAGVLLTAMHDEAGRL